MKRCRSRGDTNSWSAISPFLDLSNDLLHKSKGANLKRVHTTISYPNPLETPQQDQSRGKRSCCDRASRAIESNPSRRHRAKTEPEEQSIKSTCYTSLGEGGLHYITVVFSLWNMIEVRKTHCLVTLDHFVARFVRHTIAASSAALLLICRINPSHRLTQIKSQN